MNQSQDVNSNKEPSTPPFSPDEMRVLNECMNESFFYRCIPLSLVLGGSALILQRNGVIAKSARWGYAPKVLFASLIGYVGGKWSYSNVCAEKIMRLPNSRLGDAIRKRRGLSSDFPVDSGYGVMNTKTTEKMVDEPTQPVFYDDHSDIRQQEGLDGYNTVTETLSPYTEQDKPQQSADNKPRQSYEDLRKQNRDEFSSNSTLRTWKPESDLKPSSSSQQDDFSQFQSPPSPPSPSSPPVPYKRRNKYGDIIED